MNEVPDRSNMIVQLLKERHGIVACLGQILIWEESMRLISKKLTQWLVTAFLVFVAGIFLLDQSKALAVSMQPPAQTTIAPDQLIAAQTLAPIPTVADNVRRLLETRECVGCKLVGAALKDVNLQAVNLEGANLQKAGLERANLQGTNLAGANLQGADLGKTNIVGANLERANLFDADLEKANLQGANLQEANLQGADLEKTNLTDARIEGADLRGAA